MKKKIAELMLKFLKPLAKRGALWAINTKLDSLYADLRTKAAAEGSKALDKAFDGLQAEMLGALENHWVKRILPDAFEQRIHQAIQEEGDKFQEKCRFQYETSGLSGLDALYQTLKLTLNIKISEL